MKKIIIGAVIIVIIVGSLIAWKMYPKSQKVNTEEVAQPTVALPTVSDQISVDLKPKSDNKAVALRIKGFSTDVQSIEYELAYITGTGLPRGVLGKINIKNNEKEIIRDDIILGTCSSGKCVYDTGVTSIDLSLKFNTENGASVFRKIYPL